MFCTFWPVSTLIISMVLELHPHNVAKNIHSTVLASEIVFFMCDTEGEGVSSCYFWALTPIKVRNSSCNMMQIEPWSFQWRSKLIWTKNSKLWDERDLSYPLTSPMGTKCHQEHQNSPHHVVARLGRMNTGRQMHKSLQFYQGDLSTYTVLGVWSY